MDLYERIKRNPHNVTPKQLIELLVSYGFEYKNTEGDHAQYKRAGYGRFPVPVRQIPLAIHIVKAALRIVQEIRELEQN
jgi:predicted RNA binding protein YcfA (HicA-like mRNA interferase family)